MSHQIVILAAGKGTRMASLIPKVLIPMRGKPVIEYLLAEVAKVSKKEPPIIVVGFQHELVEKQLGSQYLYVLQAEQNGTAHAVLCARPLVTEPNILVLYGDMPLISAASLEQLVQLHETKQGKISMFTATVPNYDGVYAHFQGFGRIIRDSSGAIIKIREFADASDDEKQIQEVNPAIYMFDSAWLWPHLEAIGSQNAQEEFYLTDIIEIAIADGQSIASLPIAPEEIYGINTPDHLSHASTLIPQ